MGCFYIPASNKARKFRIAGFCSVTLSKLSATPFLLNGSSRHRKYDEDLGIYFTAVEGQLQTNVSSLIDSDALFQLPSGMDVNAQFVLHRTYIRVADKTFSSTSLNNTNSNPD